MPSSFSFLLNARDSKSDQNGDGDRELSEGYRMKRTMQRSNDMLEQPSDHDDSCSQSDVTDNDDDDAAATKHDRFTSPANTRSVFLTRQATLYAEDWPQKKLPDDGKMTTPTIETDATIADRLVSLFHRSMLSVIAFL